jgi:hypothetical protein
MKRVLFTLLTITVVVIYACGPSAEDKAREEQAKQDSIRAVQITDSMMKAQQMMQDTANKMPAVTTKK